MNIHAVFIKEILINQRLENVSIDFSPQHFILQLDNIHFLNVEIYCTSQLNINKYSIVKDVIKLSINVTHILTYCLRGLATNLHHQHKVRPVRI